MSTGTSVMDEPDEGSAVDMARSYAAFISYRHLDNRELGREWANWLHQMLETYEVPPDLIGHKLKGGDEVPARIYPVFLDEKELAGSPDLEKSIHDALERSRSLIVICSPRILGSPYVREELRHFQRLGKWHRLRVLVIAGVPNASVGAPGSTISADQECFPEELRFTVDENGQSRPAEPHWFDVRLDDDGKEGFTTVNALRDALEAQKRPRAETRAACVAYGKKLEHARLQLIAGVLGIELGELEKRDLAYQLARARRRNRNLAVVLTVITLLAAMAVWSAFQARFELAAQLEERGRVEHLGGRLDRALVLVHEAAGKHWPWTAPPSARFLLARSTAPLAGRLHLLHGHQGVVELVRYAGAAEERIVTVGADDSTRVWDSISGDVLDDLFVGQFPVTSALPSVEIGVAPRPVATSTRAEFTLTASRDDSVRKLTFSDLTRGRQTTFEPKMQGIGVVGMSGDGTRALVRGDAGDVHSIELWSLESAKPLLRFPPPAGWYTEEAAFTPDGWILVQSTRDPSPSAAGDAAAPGSEMELNLYDRDGKPLASFGRFAHPRLAPWFGITALSPDGAYGLVAVPYDDDRTELHVLRLTEPFGRLPPAERPGREIVARFDPTGRRLLLVTARGTEIWDLKNGTAVALAGAPGPSGDWIEPRLPQGRIRAAALSFSADGERVAMPAAGNATAVWKTSTGEIELAFFGHTAPVNATIFSRDSRLLASCSDDGTAVVWDIATRRAVARLAGHAGRVLNACFSTDGKRILTCGTDRTAMEWEWEKMRAAAPPPLATSILPGHTPSEKDARFGNLGIALATDARLALTGTSAGGIALWDLREQTARGLRPLATRPLEESSPTRLAFSVDAKRILLWNEFGETEMRETASDRTLTRFSTLREPGTRAPDRLVLSPGGDRVLGVFPEERLALWQVSDGQSRLLRSVAADWYSAAAWSPDAHWIACALDGGKVLLWDGVEPDPEKWTTVAQHEGAAYLLAFDPAGTRLVSCGEDRRCRIVQVPEGKLVGEFSAVAKVHDLAFDPEGERIVTAEEDGACRVWDARSGVLRLTLQPQTASARADDGAPVPDHYVTNSATRAAFSPDGALIATGTADTGGTVRVWDAVGGNLLAEWTHLSASNVTPDIEELRFTRCGERLVATTSSGGVHTFDTALETRSHADIARLAARLVPWKLDKGQLTLPVRRPGK